MMIGGAWAQDAEVSAREKEIVAASRALRQIASDVASADPSDISKRDDEIRDIIAGSRERLDPVNSAVQAASDSLSLLGPAPKEGEPPEAAAVADERAAINERLTVLRGQRTRILANIDEATALLTEISKGRIKTFYSSLLTKAQPLFAADIWTQSFAQGNKLADDFRAYFTRWSAQSGDEKSILLKISALLAAFAVSILMLGPAQRWSRRVFTARLEAHEPTQARRVAAAGIKMLTRLAPGVIGGFAVIETARAIGLLQADGLGVARAIWVGLIAFLLVQGFISGLFAPAAPNWRIAELESAKARRASGLLVSIVVVFGLKTVFVAIADAAGGVETLSTLVTAIGAIIVGALLFLLAGRSLWTRQAVTAPPNDMPDEEAGIDAADSAKEGAMAALRFSARVLGVAIIALSILGYVKVADFAASRLYYSALLLAVVWFIRAALKELTIWADRKLKAGRSGAGADGEEDKQAFVFWVGAGADLIVLVLITPILLALAGIEPEAVRDLVIRALTGFRVGGVFISFSDIFAAISTFVIILVATRVLQGALQRGPFAHSRIDTGIQNSLVTLFGYVGLVIAAIAGFSVLGFDLSNLALIAGALSVGIGFGLQSIVNNFVSGLILLFERPIKAGDWIVTTSGEGIVKKISVRSTEIETFDRSSIIIPNSELISSTVTNWTHKDRLGRIRVSIGVSYNTDPELVRDILIKCANDHPLVVRYPEPFVVWQDFGASSLDFDIRAYLRDISKGLQVKTDLRYAIFKAFKEQGIEIPFPQQDINIKSLPNGAPAPAREVPADVKPPPPKESEPELGDDD
jgi:small-conductance mechanosensitive channel